MLLPYLTDSLGIAAIAAGFIVFAPKAWDVVLNPIAGRISDRTVDPRGPRRPGCCAPGSASRSRSRCCSPRRTMGSKVAEAGWVLVCFLACATAYAFFQVPYVSMPAEMTASYDERTRLMTWRVAILAFTIMLAGATAPVIRDAVGGRAGYRVMGLAMALVIVIGVVAAYRGTRHAPVGAVEAGPGHAARPAPDRRRRARLPAAAGHLRGAGARHRLHARGRRLHGQRRARPQGRDHHPVRLLRRPGPAAHAGLVGHRRPDRQEAGLPGLLGHPRRRRAAGGAGPVGAVRARGRRGRAGRGRVRRLPGLPARDAPRRRGRRRPPDRQLPGRRLHRRLDRRRDARAGARARAVRAGAGDRRLPLEHRRRRRPARLGADRDHPRLLDAAGRARGAQPGLAGALHPRLRPGRRPDRRHHRSPA